MTSPAKRREAVKQAFEKFHISERRACRALGQPRASQRYTPLVPDDEAPLVKRIVAQAEEYGRYGYRRTPRFSNRKGER